MEKKFNPKKLEKLNNPQRLEAIPPQYIWEKLKLSNCKTIVDIGAGTGLFSRAFSDLMENGTVYAADISEPMVQWMKDFFSKDGENGDVYKNILPMIMDESQIPLEDQLSDLVLMITLHHELESPEAILTEAYRVLKKGGKICIIDWKKKEMSFGPPLEIRCSVEEVFGQLETTGFIGIQTDKSLDKFNIVWAER